MKKLTQRIDPLIKLAEKYEKNPILKTLVSLVPGADTYISTRYKNIEQERLREFYTQLADDEIEITQALLENDDFIHSFICTLRAVANTRRKEKIKQFANLLLNAVETKKITDNEYYEYYLEMLEQMDDLELMVLSKFVLCGPTGEPLIKGGEVRSVEIMNSVRGVDTAKRLSHEINYETEECLRIAGAIDRIESFKLINVTASYGDILAQQNLTAAKGYKITSLGESFIELIL